MALLSKPPEFLSADHLRAVYDAASAGDSARRSTAKRWLAAASAYGDGQEEKALALWRKLTVYDPGSADSWYALCLLSGKDREQALPLYHALALTVERFGSERDQAPVELRPRLFWRPLGGLLAPVAAKPDLAASYALLLAQSERRVEASSWSERSTGWQREAVQAYLAYEGRNYHRAVSALQAMSGSDSIRLEADFLLGECYRQLGLPTAATETLQKVIDSEQSADLLGDRRPVRELKLEARYLLAQLHQENGDPERARAELERIYATDASYRNVAEMLGAVEREGLAALNDAFEELAAQIGPIGEDIVWPDER